MTAPSTPQTEAVAFEQIALVRTQYVSTASLLSRAADKTLKPFLVIALALVIVVSVPAGLCAGLGAFASHLLCKAIAGALRGLGEGRADALLRTYLADGTIRPLDDRLA